MEGNYQRVLNLDKISSKEDAYMAGYQTKLWWKNHNSYDKHMEYLAKNQLLVECPFKSKFHNQWLAFICNNFKVVKNEVHYKQSCIDRWINMGINANDIIGKEGYERACAYHYAVLQISESSKSHIGNKLPICKKELKPYLYLGFYHSSGHHIGHGELSFINSKAAIKAFLHQLQQWYGFDDQKYFDGYITQLKDSPLYMLTMTKEGASKFMSLLPNDLF